MITKSLIIKCKLSKAIYYLGNGLKNSNQEDDVLDENYGGPLKSLLSMLIL